MNKSYLKQMLTYFSFGGEGIISENDPDEQEKRIKYNDLVSNAVILQNVVDMTLILKKLSASGVEFTKSDVASLSPYLTKHIKRFGDYVIDLKNVQNEVDMTVSIPMKQEKTIQWILIPSCGLFLHVCRLYPLLITWKSIDKKKTRKVISRLFSLNRL